MAVKVLVSVEQNKKMVFFDGSSIQELVEVVTRTFADSIPNSSKISHLQRWDKDFEEYVIITDIFEIENKSKLRAVLKVSQIFYGVMYYMYSVMMSQQHSPVAS